MVASKDTMRRKFAERLDYSLTRAGAPEGRERRAWVAARYKVQVESVRKWLTGLSLPDSARMLAIAEDLRVSADWLLIGKGQHPDDDSAHAPLMLRDGDGVAYVSDVEIAPGYVRLPLLNIEASMGHGAANDEHPEVVQYLDVADWWARQNLPSNLDRVKIISARGDSMAGVINHGDVVFVDTATDHFDGEGLYVFNWNGRALIKRLAPNLRTGQLQIQSANPAYPPENVTSEEIDGLHISGRIAAWWTLKHY